MKTSILNITGVEVLSNESLKMIKGQGTPNLSLCGCDCAGSVTGPKYCANYIACPQIYTCDQTSI